MERTSRVTGFHKLDIQTRLRSLQRFRTLKDPFDTRSTKSPAQTGFAQLEAHRGES